ncbi:hypothetical protein CALVIDRAFT_479760, partial [Calocera viscosa TUFC12733]
MRLSPGALVPVILGPTLPRSDRGVEERAEWCRAMLILFQPWRTLADILPANASWTSAFEQADLDEHVLRVIENIGVLNDCRDATGAPKKMR